MDPVTLALIGGAALGAAGPLSGKLLGQSAGKAQERELREIFGLRFGLGQSFFDPTEYGRDVGALYRQAQEQPFGPREMAQFERELQGTQAAEALGSQRMVESNLAALGVSQDRGSAIQAEMGRVRSLLGNMARANMGTYAAQQNVQQLEQTRQLLSQALTERYGTLSAILAAGV